MTSRGEELPIQHEPDEPTSLRVTLVVGAQGAMLIIAPTVLNTTVAIQASALDDAYLAWGVFAALLIAAAVTGLQAVQFWRFGGGHIVLTSPAALFIAVMAAAVSSGGPSLFATLLIISCIVQIGLAFWLPLLRRIFTPVVIGTVTMLIAVSVLPIAFSSMQNLPDDAPTISGPLMVAATLSVSVIMTLRARGRWRLAGPVISIVAGYMVAAAFGLVETERIARAPWFGIPEVPHIGLDLTFGTEFWALLPSFAILTLVLGIKTISDGVAIQQGSRRRQRAIDFRQIQGMVSVNGIGMLLGGISGTLPPMSYSSFSLSLISLTGIAARRVGISVAIVILLFALFSKVTALLLTIPGPVLGAYLMLAMGMLFVSGMQTILREGLNQKRVLIVAIAGGMGIGLHNHPIMVDLFGNVMGNLLGNGATISAIVAIGLTFVLESLGSRLSRLEVTLQTSSLPAIDEFLTGLASELGWSEASTARLRAAGEEALASLQALGDSSESATPPRLIIKARPQGRAVELEFVATTRQENIEDQLAYLTDEGAIPTTEDLPLRLLRYHSSAVRHERFFGVDIVTVLVEGGA